MNILREHLDIFDRRGRQDAVPEIEDVPRPASDALQNVFGLVEHPPWRPEQQRRIEVALDRPVESDLLPRLVNRYSPVGADHVASSLPELVEHRRGSSPEMNGGNAPRNGVKDFLGMGGRELA